MTTYIPGSLIVQNTITSDRIVTGTIDASKLVIGDPNNTSTSDRLRLFNDRLEVWDSSNSGKPRVIIGRLS